MALYLFLLEFYLIVSRNCDNFVVDAVDCAVDVVNDEAVEEEDVFASVAGVDETP